MVDNNEGALKSGACIGILGGGQLGRMLAMAAARLGFKCHIFSPEPDSCAFAVVRRATLAEYSDEAALARFADEVDVITYEFENVPAQSAEFLAARKPVFPDPKVLATTQDRLVEKDFVAGLDIVTAPYAEVASLSELRAALAKLGAPAILKTRRFGYDGKGQRKIMPNEDAVRVWRSFGDTPSILEGFVAFDCELSVIATRSRDGKISCYDVTENEHGDHILRRSIVPAQVSAQTAQKARRIAQAIAEALDYVGVLAVEMFLLRDGNEEQLVVNEIAPRVHNSGHWTLDGASISQFEQHIRAIAGMSLAQAVRHGRVEMINLIGTEVEDYEKWLDVPGASVHIYGKSAASAGRKMGHITRIFPETSD